MTRPVETTGLPAKRQRSERAASHARLTVWTEWWVWLHSLVEEARMRHEIREIARRQVHEYHAR
jgi:hypothetical protein